MTFKSKSHLAKIILFVLLVPFSAFAQRGGMVWTADGNDLAIGQVLLDLGINKKDLVIGFHAPVMRGDAEFAVE